MTQGLRLQWPPADSLGVPAYCNGFLPRFSYF
jgi:hypothetical protein